MKSVARSLVLCSSCLLLMTPVMASPLTAPPLMLANVYQGGHALAEYWISEKLDGVRGYWDGSQLWSRGGEPIHAPAWFTAGWPRQPMDGELWAGRGAFEKASGLSRQQQPDDAGWRAMHFMVFDLPAHGGVFDQRLPALRALIATLDLPWVQALDQVRIADAALLQARLDDVTSHGGEGLMLHRGASLYRADRSDDLLKLKPYDDAEARVVAQLPGNGKYQNMLGALLVETPSGLQFKLGSGFSDEERRNPPPPGSWVSYRYHGLTANGVPRFASFQRTNEDAAGAR